MARPGRPRMPKAPLPGTVEAFLDMLIAERGGIVLGEGDELAFLPPVSGG